MEHDIRKTLRAEVSKFHGSKYKELKYINTLSEINYESV